MLLSAICAVFLLVPLASAQSDSDFNIQATIPSATQVFYIVTEAFINGANATEFDTNTTFTAGASNAMSFDAAGAGMTYDSVNGIWVASRFFVIDVSPRDAGGTPAPAIFSNINLSYSGDTAPTDATSTLADKGVVTVVRVVTNPDLTQNENEILASTFGGLTGAIQPTNTDVIGGFMRVYVGIATGEPGTPGVPFTNADVPGPYSGTLTVSATVI